jgi:hypothetical protein
MLNASRALQTPPMTTDDVFSKISPTSLNITVTSPMTNPIGWGFTQTTWTQRSAQIGISSLERTFAYQWNAMWPLLSSPEGHSAVSAAQIATGDVESGQQDAKQDG